MSIVDAAAVAAELDTILRRPDQHDQRWRRWAADQLRPDILTPDLLSRLADVVRRFDVELDAYLEQPIAVPERTVVVAGSGKETFKTFNVSTAASILAASAGVRVVKGVSGSVSAVSGAADVLDALGVPILRCPADIVPALDTQRIAFISYGAFCPSYAGRYNGVFSTLTPFSFFMPVTVLAVRASRFVYGIADTRTTLAAEAIHRIRPDLSKGLVVATQPTPGFVMDEHAERGIAHTTKLTRRRVRTTVEGFPSCSRAWADAVAHRRSHAENARLVADALDPEADNGRTDLVEHNAALIIQVAHNGLGRSDAIAYARDARTSGRAMSRLSQLRELAAVGIDA